MEDKYIEDIITLKSDMKHVREEVHSIRTDLKSFFKIAGETYVRKDELETKLARLQDAQKELRAQDKKQQDKNLEQDRSIKEIVQDILKLTKDVALVSAAIFFFYQQGGGGGLI